jgi:hypothetical protein
LKFIYKKNISKKQTQIPEERIVGIAMAPLELDRNLSTVKQTG